MVQGAVVEARVELAVPDLRKGGPGDLVAQIEVKQRVALDRARQQVAETQRLRVGKRADPRTCAATSPLSDAARLFRSAAAPITRNAIGSSFDPSGVRVIPVAPRSNSGTPSSSSSARIWADTAGWLT